MNTWTKPHYGVSHTTIGKLWVTTCNYGSFTEVSIRRAFTMRPIENATFFKNSKPADSQLTSPNFWSQGDAHEDNAQAWGEKQAITISTGL